MSAQQQSAQADDRGARVIARALEIMKQGHYGWSWALAEAKKQVK